MSILLSSGPGSLPAGRCSRQHQNLTSTLRTAPRTPCLSNACLRPAVTALSRPQTSSGRKPGICRSSTSGQGKPAGPRDNGHQKDHKQTQHLKHTSADGTGRLDKETLGRVSDSGGNQQDNEYAHASEEALRALHEAAELGTLPKNHTSRRGVLNQVQLSTYADCIGNNLQDLTNFLDNNIKDAIGSIHLLPLYPSTGDRGFAPVNYQEVDPTFGEWKEVHALANRYQLCLEFMVNHISPASPQFQDFIEKGEKSKYYEMFVKWRDIWPDGAPTAEELLRIRTRKPAPPVIEIKLKSGEDVPLWCTFGDQQIDINPFTQQGWKFIEDSLRSLCKNGHSKMIRLDAFGYVTKKAGTSCFMQEPEVWELLERIKKVAKPFGVQLLCEVHEDFNLNIELARHGFWVYDFALPLLVIHALQFKTAEPLKHWLSICPRRQITTLDTHDGMGVDDITGLAPLAAVPELERSMLGRGGNINYKHFYHPPQASTEHNFEFGAQKDNKCNIDGALQKAAKYLKEDCLQGCYRSAPHQYNETYFSALGEDARSYLLSRAVQFFTPGIPMVYYVGLLAGVNDYKLMEKTGGIRDINRHYYTVEEAHKATQRPVVQALLQLCRFRNTHPAFRGRIYIDDRTPEHQLHVRWYWGSGKHLAILRADFRTKEFTISHTPYEQHALPADLAAVDAVTDDNISPFSLEFTSFSSLDMMDIETRKRYRHQIAEALLEAASHTGAEWMEQQQQSNTASSGQGIRPDELAQALDAAVSAADGAGTFPRAMSTDMTVSYSEPVSVLESMSDDESSSDYDGMPAGAKTPRPGGKGMKGGLQMQQLDLSWAWKMADKPVPPPSQRLAATLMDEAK